MGTTGDVHHLKRVHVCVLDKGCREDFRVYGMPMRVHLRSKTLRREMMFTLPGLSGTRRSKKIWDEAEPVEIEVRKPER